MKKIALTLLLALVAMVTHAETFTNGNFTYLINSDGTVLCQGLSSAGASATSITIPGYVWDSNNSTRRRVIGINSSAFSGNNNLTTVTINYGVRDIYGYAFQNCQNLKTLYLPSSIEYIYSYAFHNTSLQWVHCAAETMPFDYILNGNATGVNVDAADCDQNGTVGISDVTALIDYILNGTWP